MPHDGLRLDSRRTDRNAQQFIQRALAPGLGRGTAKLEYNAFVIDISEARERFGVNRRRTILDARAHFMPSATIDVKSPDDLPKPASHGFTLILTAYGHTPTH